MDDLTKREILADLNAENLAEDYEAAMATYEDKIASEEPEKAANERERKAFIAKYAKKGAEASLAALSERKAHARNIRNAAVNQTDISLQDIMTQKQIQLLIKTLTDKEQRIMDRSLEFINDRLAYCLLPLIPRSVKNCWKEYPLTMVPNPGFYYIASEEYGKNCKLWVTPAIPYYFEQGTEMDILREKKAKYLFAVDKAVANYVRRSRELLEKQAEYAQKYTVEVYDRSFYTLLKKFPFWFERYYNAVYKDKKTLL